MKPSEISNDKLKLLRAKYLSLDEKSKMGFLSKIKEKSPSLYDKFIEKINESFQTIPRLEKRDFYQASSAQKRLFLIDQIEGSGISYNATNVVSIKGFIDRNKFSLACSKLIERHEVLRTRFEMKNGKVVQIVDSKVDFEVEFILRDQIPQEDQINSFIRPFTLDKSPLIRIGLLEINKDSSLLILDMHHIISDGISMSILFDELFQLYEGKKLEQPGVQYKDFAEWQNRYFLSESMQGQKKYWEQEFSGEIPILNMPTDFPRPSVQSTQGAHLNFSVGEALTKKLLSLARENGATLFMVLLSAYYVLLSKYTGQEDIIVGTPIAGRRHADLDRVVGMFINTLVLRNYPEKTMKFKDFLETVKARVLGAYEHQEYPFEELIDHVKVRRDISRNPIFDTMFVLQNIEGNQYKLSDLEVKEIDFDYNVSKFDFTLTATESNHALEFTLEYATKLFESRSMQRFLQHYVQILKEISNNSEVQIRNINILLPSENKLILNSFNDTEAYYPRNKQVQELFENQVSVSPRKTAIVVSENSLTYEALNTRSNQLARALRDRGVGPDHRVALLLDRSIEMVVGILAILKAGSAYVPIDPAYPDNRIEYMLADSEAKILLSQSHIRKAKGFHGLRLNLDDKTIFHGNSDNLKVLGTSRNLSYVIYTSGSTGRPKGVMLEHQQLVNFIFAMRSALPIEEEDVFLSTTTVCFDIFGLEFYLPLLFGNKLIIADENQQKDPKKLSDLIKKNKVDIIQRTPSTIDVLTQNGALEHIRLCLVGGEALSEDILSSIKKKTNARIFNMFGPTETTIWSTMAELTSEQLITIGKPINNNRIYILDSELQLLPIGVVGELFIGGEGVARGYWNREDLTTERFIKDPFFAGNNMYRTGDLARWLPDGKIEFLGRVDHQVKVRGFRIELGEIESCMNQIKGIQDSVVLALEKENEKYLVGYYVCDEAKSVEVLRQGLGSKLPDYMIPNYYIHLDSVPLTPNGKVNRKALPMPEGNIQLGVEYLPPTDETEKKLVDLWQNVLGIKKVGIKDNFFELGGHSLKATTLVSEIHRALDIQISLQDIFSYPNIKSLRYHIKGLGKQEFEKIETIEEKVFYQTSSSQKRLFLLDQIEGKTITYNLPYILCINGNLDVNRLKRAFLALMDRHHVFRTSFSMNDGMVVQKLNPGVSIELELQDCFENDVQDLISKFIRPFDLSLAPLIRGLVVRLEVEKHLLLLDMHHIISDGMSLPIIQDELFGLYEGDSLQKNEIQYKDFSAWQNLFFQTSEFQRQEKYWQKEFAGEIPVLNMPADFPRPAIQNMEGRNLTFTIEPKILDRLKEIGKENGATLFMVLLGAYNILLHKYTGQEDIVVGSPIAGRRHVDLQRMLGMFVNTLALRNFPKPSMSFTGFLSEIKERVLAAYEHQDFPFEELVEQTQIVRDVSRNPLFDTMFVLQNMDTPTSKYNDFEVNEYDFEYKISKFDFSLTGFEVKDSLQFYLEYATKLFYPSTMQRFAKHFSQILEQIAMNPSVCLKDIQMIHQDEQQQILVDFNDTQTFYPEEQCIHEIFEQQVQKYPNRVAVKFENTSLTYNELNVRSNQLAKVLRNNGVGEEKLVPIIADRSLEMIIGILAILKAGAAYVPIDPDYPSQRIEFILKDTNSTVLLTKSTLDFHGSFSGVRIHLDEELNYQGDSTNLAINVHPKNLAYVIYTSGSTGKPKGVLIEHRNVVRLLFNDRFQFDFDQYDVWSVFHSFCFDFSVWEMYGSLLNGGTAVIISQSTTRDPIEFADILRKEGITILNQTPGAFYRLMEAEAHSLEKLQVRLVIFGGESLTPNRLLDWHNRYTNCKLINMYGITEITVHGTFKEIDEVEIEKNISNIGKPLPTLKFQILNSEGQLCPIGVAGEICVSGVGLARGYLNLPELTEQKFVPNPFEPEQLMYKTGDLARWLEDGDIEYLGRIDHQVKIRGFRIELGEIEHQLLLYEDVLKALVLPQKDSEGNQFLCAYLINKKPLAVTNLRSHLKKTLPDYMVPTSFIELKDFPLTANGKIDKKALAKSDGSLSTGTNYVAPRDEVEMKLAEVWSEALGIGEIGIEDNFFDLGGNSLIMVRVSSKLSEKFEKKVPVVALYSNTTIKQLADFLAGENRHQTLTEEIEDRISKTQSDGVKLESDIAIIGMSGRFPGAANVEELWENLRGGVESLQRFSRKELLKEGFTAEALDDPNFVPVGSLVSEKENFDGPFFEYAHLDAEYLDPQVRIFHELVWHALEDGGYDPRKYKGLIGLYAGAPSNIDWINRGLKTKTDMGEFEVGQLVSSDFLTTRISYKLGLMGPSYFLQTACSTSLTSVVIATTDLMVGKCDMALAGGITISSLRKNGYVYEEGMIASPDGHCRAFDAEAAGTVFGEGGGVVLLKRLSDAQRDGDQIYAVIKGAGNNNDGDRKVGFTAPSVMGQAELIRSIQKKAGIDPETIGYVETHGTGTKMGDPIELEGLKRAFGTEKKNYCAIGSLKANIGHLDSGAGITGLIKATLALKHQELPPQINFTAPNPLIEMEDSPFYVNTSLKKWEPADHPRRAGVSSFGIGGTNAHVLLEEYKSEPLDGYRANQQQTILLSAKTRKSLDAGIEELGRYLKKNKELRLEDLSYTMSVGRSHFRHRYSLSGSNGKDLIEKLSNKGSGRYYPKLPQQTKSSVVFMYPGQGSQYAGMGLDLYRGKAAFRKNVDGCFEILKDRCDFDLKALFLDEQLEEKWKGLQQESQVSSTLLFILEYSLSQYLESLGVVPELLIGHSLGEYAAACISGVLTLEDALELIYRRGLLVNRLPAGQMLSTNMPEETILEQYGNHLSLAVENSSELRVVSGSPEAIGAFKAHCEEDGYLAKILDIGFAYHSYQLDEILPQFRKLLEGIKLQAPKIPYVSNLSGEMITKEEAQNPEYWCAHFRNTVRFSTGLKKVLEKDQLRLVEIGPGNALQSLSSMHIENSKDQVAFNLMRHSKEPLGDTEYLDRSLADLWGSGVEIDWERYYKGEGRKKISGPRYAFEKHYYGKLFDLEKLKNEGSNAKPTKEKGIEDLTYVPIWTEAPFQADISEFAVEDYVVFTGTDGVSEQLVARLRELGSRVVTVSSGDKYHKKDKETYVLDQKDEQGFGQLLEEVLDDGFKPKKLIYLWSAQGPVPSEITSEIMEKEQDTCFMSPLYLIRSINQNQAMEEMRLILISRGLCNIKPTEKLDPLRSILQGLSGVVGQEYERIETQIVDISPQETQRKIEEVIESLILEIIKKTEEKEVAHRGKRRWVPRFEQREISAKETKIKKNGVYLITGGLGAVGLHLSGELARKYKAKIILTSRNSFPDRSQWQTILAKGANERNRKVITKVQEIEQHGGQVLIVKGDSTQIPEMKQVLDLAEEKFQRINGVFHASSVSSMEMLESQNREGALEIVKPKINGVLGVSEVFKDYDLDFLMLFSSMSAVVGGLGFGAYAAGNAFMNSYSSYQRNRGISNIYSYSWPGLFSNNEMEEKQGAEVGEGEVYGITHGQMMDCIESTLGSKYENVFVSPEGVNDYIRETRTLKGICVDTETVENGKHFRPELDTNYVAPRDEVEKKLAEVWSEALGIGEIGIEDNFFDLGGNSLIMVRVSSKLSEKFEKKVPVVALYSNTTIKQLADFLAGENRHQTLTEEIEDRISKTQSDGVKLESDIAIIGMSGRFPGAANVEELWENLRGGVESLQRFSRKELLKEGFTAEALDDPNFVPVGSLVSEKENFDGPFFEYAHLDAEYLDPQSRVFHELVWHALEDGGYDPRKYKGLIGLYAGAPSNIDWINRGFSLKADIHEFEKIQLLSAEFLSTRVSYKLGLMGPSYFLQTACSTSLTTVVQACHDLQRNECDMALAGGITISSLRKNGYVYEEGMIASPDGHCRAFDAEAAGTVFGEGGGVVLLKRLSDAQRDGDQIYAVIKGAGNNNDGDRKVGFTAPSVMGQAELIRSIQKKAGIDPETIGYVETHGTGTKMGDPIELEGLKRAFGTEKKNYCAIGSLKANIGHLDSGAGITGLIKATLALKHQELPPQINFTAPNPLIEMEDSPFYVNTSLKKWEPADHPRRAGVSSFGIGGTNAHVLLEEYKSEPLDGYRANQQQTILLSAKTRKSLDAGIEELGRYLKKNKELRLEDLSYTMSVGRSHFRHRYSLSGSNGKDLIEKLSNKGSGRYYPKLPQQTKSSVVFMYPGQGSQYAGMGLDLYRGKAAFRKNVDGCFEILKDRCDFDLKALFLDEQLEEKWKGLQQESQVSSTLLFILEYSLSQYLESLGVVPELLIGHSLGEYAAACISGVLTLEDALELIYRRGLLVNRLPAGQMLSTNMPEETILEQYGNHLSLAVENSSELRVVSGSPEAIGAFKAHCEEDGYLAKILDIGFAYHSYQLDEILPQFRKLLEGIKLQAPKIPYVSNLSGEMITKEEAQNPEYWCAHFRNTVRFSTGLKKVLEKDQLRLVEIGPGNALQSLSSMHIENSKDQVAFNLMRHSKEPLGDTEYLDRSLADLWGSGVEIDWERYYKGEGRKKISGPRYAFEKHYYGKLFDLEKLKNEGSNAKPTKEKGIEDLTYVPIWTEAPFQADISEFAVEDYVVFTGTDGVSEQLVARLRELGSRVVTVSSGDKYHKKDKETYVLDQKDEQGFGQLLEEVLDDGFKPKKLIYLWSAQGPVPSEITSEIMEKEQDTCFMSPLYLIRSINQNQAMEEMRLILISRGLYSIESSDEIDPYKSLFQGLSGVIGQEYERIETQIVDISPQETQRKIEEVVESLILEIIKKTEEKEVAHRGKRRWVPRFEQREISAKETKIKKNGVYLITGGLGAVGLHLSGELARKYKAKIILTSRNSFPDRSQWQTILAKGANERNRKVITKVQEIEQHGGQVLIVKGDSTQIPEMKQVLDLAEEKFQRINGVFHASSVSSMEMLESQNREGALEIVKPKINGVLGVSEVFKDYDLDFLMLFSSMSAVVGGLGFGAYAAGNAFMNSYSSYQRNRGISNIYSYSWPGLFSNNEMEEKQGAEVGEGEVYGITHGQMMDCIESTLGSKYENVFVSPEGVNDYIRETRTLKGICVDTETVENGKHFRPELDTNYVAPRDEVEKKLAEVWSEVLGLVQIGVSDDFFNLGGNSLKATILVSKINEKMNVQVRLSDVLTMRTIAKIGELIAKEDEQLSDDMFQGLLAKMDQFQNS